MKSLTIINSLKDKVILGLLTTALLLATLLIFLQNTHKKSEAFDSYLITIQSLKNSDLEFDKFLHQNVAFYNYDAIVQLSLSFQNQLAKLGSKEFVSTFGDSMSYLHKSIEQIYELKMSYIERFKSHNASVLNSVHYLFDLHKTIQDTQVSNQEIHRLIEKSLFSIYQIIIYQDIPSHIIHNVEKIKSHPSYDLLHEYEYYYEHSKSLLKSLTNLNTNRKKGLDVNLYAELQKFENALLNLKNDHKFLEMSIIYLFFFLTFLLLGTLLFSYLRSQKIKQELASFKLAVEKSDNTVVMTDSSKNITFVNDAFEKNTGYKKDDVMGLNPRILQSGELDRAFYNKLNTTIQDGKNWEGEFINKKANGEIFYEKASIMPLYDDTVLKGYLAIKLNVTDYIKQKEKAEFLAYHDSLTTLSNRRSFEEDITEKIENSLEEYLPFALLYVDLDGFKNVNDTLGHDIGDKLIANVSKRFSEVLRFGERLYRIGGDEFVLIVDLQNKSKKDVYDTCKMLLRLLEDSFVIENHNIKIGASIGIAFYPEDGKTLNHLLSHADMAMYNAKDSGKNRFQIYQKEMSQKVYERIKIERALLDIDLEEEISLVYQPKYILQSKEIFSLEALVRWNSKELGNVPPDIFIPIAEEGEAIHKIGKFVFHRACLDLKLIRSHHKSVRRVSINLSTKQLQNPNIFEELNKIMLTTNTDPNHIGIEITETSLMENIDQNLKTLQKFRNIGVAILIDDFGTGYSSMNYLKLLPIDFLKIDKSFIDDVTTSQNDKTITQAIISLAKTLGLGIVAEGVETKDQEDFLIENGVEIAQGYLYSKPIGLFELLRFQAPS